MEDDYDFDEIQKEMERESDMGVKAHLRIVQFLGENLPQSEDMKHTSVVVITHTPNDLYKVNYVGSLIADELYFGLGIAKELVMRKSLPLWPVRKQ